MHEKLLALANEWDLAAASLEVDGEYVNADDEIADEMAKVYAECADKLRAALGEAEPRHVISHEMGHATGISRAPAPRPMFEVVGEMVAEVPVDCAESHCQPRGVDHSRCHS
jgi:hypothetical protein